MKLHLEFYTFLVSYMFVSITQERKVYRTVHSRKAKSQLQEQNSWAGKMAPWLRALQLQDSHKGRMGETTVQSCPVTSTCTPWQVWVHTCTHTHAHASCIHNTIIIITIIKEKSSWGLIQSDCQSRLEYKGGKSCVNGKIINSQVAQTAIVLSRLVFLNL